MCITAGRLVVPVDEELAMINASLPARSACQTLRSVWSRTDKVSVEVADLVGLDLYDRRYAVDDMPAFTSGRRHARSPSSVSIGLVTRSRNRRYAQSGQSIPHLTRCRCFAPA